MSAPPDDAASGAPSPFFALHRERLAAAVRATRAPLLDLACGHGRHALAAAEAGLPVVALDRKRESLDALAVDAARRSLEIGLVQADLETSTPTIPLKSGSCGAILVFRFLYRPLCSAIEDALAPGGLLLYETFTRDQPSLGWGPRSPRFLLAAGELTALFPRLEVLAHEEGLRRQPRDEYRASLLARKPLP